MQYFLPNITKNLLDIAGDFWQVVNECGSKPLYILTILHFNLFLALGDRCDYSRLLYNPKVDRRVHLLSLDARKSKLSACDLRVM